MRKQMRIAGCLLMALVILLSAAAIAKRASPYSRSDAERQLRAARTAAEEDAAFDRMWEETRVAFSLHDAAGNELDIHAPEWPPKGTARIRFHQFDPPLDHALIDIGNLETLMRE